MPILTLDCADPRLADPALARPLADAAAGILGCPPGECWLRLRRLAAYAENGCADPPRPVFVELLRAELPDRETLEQETAALTAALAGVLGIEPELVHVIHAPPASGRAAFGGRLVK